MSDLTGMRFGLLSVTGKDEPQGSRAMWRVRCLCGGVRVVRGDHLLGGRTKSCGCATNRFKKSKMEKKFSLVNKRFGNLLVVWRKGSEQVGESSHALWECKCDCGNMLVVRAGALTGGRTTHCGCKVSSVFILEGVTA